ncbi:hypothetical protein FV226_14520 [Methylobacterium sp. WL12]|nr:hypothetical protein FV226_14520 [Methylobacterium sp. WL12]
MTKPDANHCEVKVNGAWKHISLIEAQGIYAKAGKRCPACHGRVAVSGSYTALGKRVLVHRRNHDGCPLISKAYCGTLSLHPEAVE